MRDGEQEIDGTARAAQDAQGTQDTRPQTSPQTSTPAAFAAAGDQLIQRAPTGYLWNQAGSIWLFLSLLLFEVIIRRTLTPSETNIFDLVSTIANLGFYIASLGLSSAGNVFLPRALAEGGPALALSLARRLIALRLSLGIVVGAVFVWGLPALVSLVDGSGWRPGIAIADSVTMQAMIEHRVVIAAYLVCTGMSTLLSNLLIALIYTRIVFIVNSIGQLVLLGLCFVLIGPLGLGVDGAIAAQALPAVFVAIVFLFALRRVLPARANGKGYPILRPTLRLAVASWLADLPNSSLVQPLAISQLAAVAPGQLRFFKSTYQMGDAGARFFTDGLGGISMSTMTISYEKGIAPLAVGWRTVSKLQVLLAVPLVVFSMPHAGNIMRLLFGTSYAQSGPLLAVFLALNGLTQLLGGATHEWALYVLGRQQWVVVSRWVTLGILALSGALLVPQFAALGALLAVGIGRLVAQIFLLALARIWVRRPYPFAFVAKLLLALVIPVLVTIFLQPTAQVSALMAALTWLPTAIHAITGVAVLLVVNLLIFAALFVLCLRIIRPLDADDIRLLGQVPPWLSRLLRPFARAAHPTITAE
jgi:O-antigen/teichoic acid export membrane protein